MNIMKGKHVLNITLWSILLIMVCAPAVKLDKPCAARQVPDKSVVCVCNDTYCDTVTRESPRPGTYVAYTSSKAGSRFKKSYGGFHVSNISCPFTLLLDPSTQYQSITGFGAAITDSAALNWLSLPTAQLRKYFIDSHFSNEGLQYNVLRVPIGGTDFSTHKYAYNELPLGDVFLSNFSLAYEDIHYKIPMIKAAFAASDVPVYILGTTWAPPEWMTDKSNYTTCGRLKMKYYQTYADYHYKFIENYDKEGVPVWGITTTNEPALAFLPLKKFNCMSWSAHHMGTWITNYLGPRIRYSKYKNVKIIGVDDQRHTIPLWFIEMVEENPEVLHVLDGIGVHSYSNFFTPPEELQIISKTYPDLFIMTTETSEGAYPWEDIKMDLGSWERAKSYINTIITDLKFSLVGWLDWNICLNEKGGPTWAENYIDSPVIVSARRGEFYKQPMYYAMGHVSKFLPRGSRMIKVEDTHEYCQGYPDPEIFTVMQRHDPVTYVGFLTPQDTIVVVLHNDGPATTIRIQLRGKQATVDLEESSIVTVELRSG